MAPFDRLAEVFGDALLPDDHFIYFANASDVISMKSPVLIRKNKLWNRQES